MKMTELRAENESLKQQIQLLSQQKEGGKDTDAIAQLKDKNRSLKKSIKDLKAEKVILSGQIQTLENDKSSQAQEHQTLKLEFDRIQQQLSELSDVHARTASEVESLRVDHETLLEKASQIPILQAELMRLQQVDNICSEKSAQVDALQADLEQRNQLLEEVRAKASQEQAEYQDQKMKLTSEMEMSRNKLLAELEAQREESGSQIGSLQAQKDGLSTKITELTEKLKLVATHLERQLREKQKITYQYETSSKEHQTYKEQSEKRINELMALLQKMAAELDASRAANPIHDTQPVKINEDKPGSLANASKGEMGPQLQELHAQLTELDKINASQAHELAALSARMKRINHALATPLGRLISPLLGLKE